MAILENLGALAGGLVVGGIAAISLIGKIVNHQVSKSFEISVNGDDGDNLGLRSSLKEMRGNIEKIATKVTAIEQNQALMQQSLQYRDERCEVKHATLDKVIEKLSEKK